MRPAVRLQWVLLAASLPLPPPFDALSSEDLRRARAVEERYALDKIEELSIPFWGLGHIPGCLAVETCSRSGMLLGLEELQD